MGAVRACMLITEEGVASKAAFFLADARRGIIAVLTWRALYGTVTLVSADPLGELMFRAKSLFATRAGFKPRSRFHHGTTQSVGA